MRVKNRLSIAIVSGAFLRKVNSLEQRKLLAKALLNLVLNTS